MLTVTGLWFDHERTPVGLDHTPVFGWQLEGNCRNIRQTQYRLQVALTPDFAALLYDETCETGNSTAVHAAGLTLQSLQKYYARVQVWADTAAGPQQTLWSEPAVFITALLDPAAEWKAEFVSAESPETCRKSSAGTMVRAAFTVKPGLRAAYACTTALGLYNVYLNGQKVSTDEMTPGWTSYNRRLLYQTYEVTAMLHPGLNMAGAMLGAGWYKGVMGLTRSRNNYGDTTAFAMQLTLVYADGTRETVNTGPAWQGTKAPVIFSEIYHGETYDAALELPHWAECETPENTPAGRWHAVHTVPYPAARPPRPQARYACSSASRRSGCLPRRMAAQWWILARTWRAGWKLPCRVQPGRRLNCAALRSWTPMATPTWPTCAKPAPPCNIPLPAAKR